MTDRHSTTGTELWRLGASQQVSLTLSGQVSCRELVESHLARIAEVNPTLGAITRTLKESALAAAVQADRASNRGPLHGLPFTVKEDIDCVGSPTTHGVPALRDALPYVDAPIVARLKAAGAIVIGRSNLSEMGLHRWNQEITASRFSSCFRLDRWFAPSKTYDFFSPSLLDEMLATLGPLMFHSASPSRESWWPL